VVVENPRDPEARASAGAGLGLDNVRRRLAAVYGEDARLAAIPEATRFQTS
jgi:LytS/YehU family sensor histidine kinase